MASKIGMLKRQELAQNRIDAALPNIADLLEIDIDAIPVNRDRELQKTLRQEWLADTLEAIATAVAA